MSPSFEARCGKFLCHHISLACASLSKHPTLSTRYSRATHSCVPSTLCSTTSHPSISCSCSCYNLLQFATIMPESLLETGRRRTKLDRSYNGPPRQGPVRHISPAQLNLERIHEQNRANVQKFDPAKALAPAPGAAARGKPRLLLMGQRRCAFQLILLWRH